MESVSPTNLNNKEKCWVVCSIFVNNIEVNIHLTGIKTDPTIYYFKA